MLVKKDAESYGKYLFSDYWLSDETIEECKQKTKTFFKRRDKPPKYDEFLAWKRAKNEIPVFTLYAYADIAIPKNMDIIFDCRNPSIYQNIPYSIAMAIHEGWAPFGSIGNGHKHLCIMKFDGDIPPLLKMLKPYRKTRDKDNVRLGFCCSEDFALITQRIEKVNGLIKKYGNEYWNYDDGKP